MPSREEKAVATANAYSQGDIAKLDDAMTRRLIASVVLTESNGGDLNITNTLGYVGRYQAGAGWLADAGFVDGDKLRAAMAKDGFTREAAWGSKGYMTDFLSDPSNWKGGLNLDQYRASAELQDRAFKIVSDKAYRQALREGSLSEKDDALRVAGYLKARHISGAVGARKALDGIVVSDGYQTSNIKYFEDIARDGDGLNQQMGFGQKQHLHTQVRSSESSREIDAVLRRGAHGPAVGELQNHLRDFGYTDYRGRPLVSDGHFGNNTYQAVVAFQRDYGLSVDGMVGPKTWAALREAERTKSIPSFPQMMAPPDLDTTAIRTLQQHLNTLQVADHRNHALPITGAYDEATRSAVSAFQQAQGLPDTGIADPATCGLIEARATIAQLQQSASMRMGPASESPLDHVAQPVPEQVVTPRHHDAGSPQDTLTIMQAQLQDMQRQMEAMTRQREHGREKDKAQDDSRAVSNEPTRDPTHQARREEASVSAEPLSYSNPHHPQHALYARLKELLPPGTSEARLAQSTAACYMGRITQPEQLHEIHIVKGAVHFLTTRPDAHASIDMTQPAPTVRQSMQQVQTYEQQQTQMWAQFQAQQVHAQHGSPMHASVLH